VISLPPSGKAYFLFLKSLIILKQCIDIVYIM
jgi:hypothetical protein